jgi:protein CrcB
MLDIPDQRHRGLCDRRVRGADYGPAHRQPLWRLFFATGFLGGYTTFSSYTWEALLLAQTGDWMRAGAYVLGSNAVGLIGVWVGASLTRLLPF